MSLEAAYAKNWLDRSLVRGLVWTGAVKWGSQILSWVSTIVVARLLSPEDYGLVAMAGVFLGLIGLLNEFGLGAAVVALRHLTADQIAQIHGLAGLFGVAGFLISCAVAIPAARFFGASELPLIIVAMSAGFVLLAIRSVPSALLEKDLRFKFLAFLEGGQSILTTVTTVVLASKGAGYWALVFGGLAGQAGATAVIWTSQPLRYAWPSIQSLKEAIQFSSHVLLSRVAWYVSATSDVFIAGRVLGQAMVGTYSFAGNLANVPLEKITGMLSRVMPAYYSTVQNSPAALRRYLLLLTEGLALVTFPLAVGMALVAQDFVSVALGSKWSQVAAPLRILAGWAALRSIFILIGPLLYVTGGSRVAMRNGFLCLATFPPAFYIGSHWGVVGLATAWVVVQPASWIAPVRHVLKATELSLGRYLAALWPAVSGVAVMAVAVYGAQEGLPGEWHLGLRLVCEVAAGGFAYAAVTFVFHRRRVQLFIDLVRSPQNSSL